MTGVHLRSNINQKELVLQRHLKKLFVFNSLMGAILPMPFKVFFSGMEGIDRKNAFGLH